MAKMVSMSASVGAERLSRGVRRAWKSFIVSPDSESCGTGTVLIVQEAAESVKHAECAQCSNTIAGERGNDIELRGRPQNGDTGAREVLE